MNEHLIAAARYLVIAEADDTKFEAYKAAAEEMGAYQEETGESAASIAILIDCSAEKVRKLLAWRKRGYTTESPYDEGPEKRQQQRARESHAKRVLRDPEERSRVMADLTTQEKAEIVKEAIEDDDEVAEAVADVAEEKAAQRRFTQQQARTAGRQPTPVGEYFWRMVNKLGQWSRDLAWIHDELPNLPEGEQGLVIQRHRELIAAAQANLDALEGKTPDSDIIEGRVVDMPRRIGA